MGTLHTDVTASRQFCTQCGRPFSPEELARFGPNLVCAECKPRFVQQMREGVAAAPGTFVYGGFWRRVLALLLDGIILGVIYFPVQMLLLMMLAPSISRDPQGIHAGSLVAAFGAAYAFNIVLGVCYQGYFLSQKSATPGKMILGLKVITPGGGRISVGRAVGRYFGYILDGLTLGIGYLIVAFDSEKRGLHDYICGTRVIREK